MTSDLSARTPEPARGARVRSASFRRDVQGLRAIAVVAVVLNHLTGWPSGGFVGVDIFFVISGYLITGILLREHDRTGSISFRGFYVRRARRILPAAVLVLGVTVIAAGLLLPRSRAIAAAIDSLWAAFFAANWRMSAIGTDYFQLGLPPSPVQHYWSLSVEEQFYLVWPCILLGLLIIGARKRWTANRRSSVVAVAMASIVVVSFTWALVETSTTPTAAYFSTFSRGWELGIGALVAILAPRLAPRRVATRLVLAWLGLIGIAVSLLAITSLTPFPAPGAALPVIFSALVLLAGARSQSQLYDRGFPLLTNRVAGYLGNISYSIYLWHLPVIVLLLAVFPAGSKKYLVASLAGTAVLAVISFHFVEEPIRKSAWLERFRVKGGSRTKSRVSLVRSRSVLAAVAATVAVAVIVAGFVVLRPVVPGSNEAASGTTLSSSACFGAAVVANASHCANVKPTGPLTPSVDEAESDTGVAFSCYRTQGHPMKTCRFGSEENDAMTVALVGDSHAAMLLPGLVDQLKGQNWALDTFVGYGCQWRDTKTSDCSKEMADVQSRLIDQRRKYDLVITSAARWTNGSDPQKAAAAYAAFWEPVEAVGTRVVAVDDVPAVSTETLQCVARVNFDPTNSACQTQRSLALAVPDPLPIAAAKVHGAASVDLTDFFCARTACPAVIGNVLVYRDTASHMTATFSRSLGPFLVKRIDAILAG